MAGSVKTDGIVLRSIRYGEGDRVLHLYTPHRGRLGAIAKGARKARSRFGGRLEPFFHLRLVLHEGDPCPRCGGPVRKIVAGGRGTYVCERCQPRPRSRRRIVR